MTEESVLVEKLREPGSREAAFRELVALYQQRLYWHIRRIVLTHDDADDVLQETFIKVFRNIEGFKGDSKLFSWMYRIATNEALRTAPTIGINEVMHELRKKVQKGILDNALG